MDQANILKPDKIDDDASLGAMRDKWKGPLSTTNVTRNVGEPVSPPQVGATSDTDDYVTHMVFPFPN